MDLIIEDYMRGKTGYTIPDAALKAILSKRGIESGVYISTLTTEKQELCVADLYVYCTNIPSTVGVTMDAHGGWKHQDGGWQATEADKKNLLAMANAIYSKYGETKIGDTSFKIIKL